ncbi:MAG: hypothetical protein GY715_17030 [Planctomycetes bacterium]|nr:hypothetical protein [Planctomycetota bacterium]
MLPRARSGSLHAALLALAFGVLSVTAAAQRGPDPFDACARQLRRTITAYNDGSHLPRLLALRQLREPTLRPLFRRIAQHDHWQMQVHAILGLTEIDRESIVDRWLVTRAGAAAQEALFANAIDLELVSREHVRELVQWEELAPAPRLLLIGELVLADEPVDRSLLAALSGRPQETDAGLASLFLARLGDPAALSAYTDRIGELPRRDRNLRIMWLLEAIRQYEVAAVLPWVVDLVEQRERNDEVAYWAIYTALLLDPPTGLRLWNRALGAEPAERDRIRYGMMLLAAAEHVPASSFDRLAGTSDLTAHMAAAGRAVASGTNVAPALTALLDLGHPKTTSWVMTAVEDRPEASLIYGHIVDSIDDARTGRAERLALAVSATARLFEIDPGGVLRRLEEADDDSARQEVLLLGLFDSRSPAAGAAASGIRRIGAGRADTLALLLIARHNDELAPEDVRRLGLVASGGGRVSGGLQTQAAWLYLKHTGGINRALKLVFEDDA